VCVASCCYNAPEDDPEALIVRYHALSGWAAALVEAGAARVTVVQRCGRDAFIRRDGVEYHFVADGAAPSPPPWFWGSRMCRLINERLPDVVHVHGLVFPLFVRNLRRKLRDDATILVQDHGAVPTGSLAFRSRSGRAFYRLGLGAADGFLFTAKDQAAPWRQSGIIGPAQRIYEIVEASTDLLSAEPATRTARADEALRRLPGRPALLWVGRLDANKDPLGVLDGIERAVASLPDLELTMVYSDDVLLPDVKDRIVRSPVLRSRVHLSGKVERSALRAIYAGADVFVLGSHREVACFSLLEALSFGLVPVVTDIPPFRAVTDRGRLGALFAPGDGASLALAIERVASRDLVTASADVRDYFERELCWPATARKALAIYRDAVARRSQARV
jgi:glycosyltransferase involved in cell wall biosynthesis